MSQAKTILKSGNFEPGDEKDILALNLQEYGERHVMISAEDFQWRFEQNPAGQAVISVVRDESSGRVIAFTWMVPIQMRLFEHTRPGAMTANQLVHPDFRNTMAYVHLIRHRIQRLRQERVSFRFSFPIEEIWERMRKIEKLSSFTIPLLIRPLDIQTLARHRFSEPWKQRLVSWGGYLGRPLLFPYRIRAKIPEGLSLQWIDEFDNSFNDFWERVKDKYNIAIVRDQAFLNWRFAPVSGREYQILSAVYKKRLVGYLVLRCTDEIRGIPTGLVMDFLLEPGAMEQQTGCAMLAQAQQYFLQEKVWIAGGLALPHTTEFEILRRAGYIPCPARIAPRTFRVAYECLDPTLPDTTDVRPADWFLTIADYEAH
jgi:hypothetical protein